MSSDNKILIAFLLNLFFSVFEFFGGLYTNSVSILSDAIHDMGDAFSIGIAFILEKISKKKPDDNYTYGYARYSIIGSLISTMILLFGSAFMIFSAIKRIINPVEVHYDGMFVMALFGVVINFIAVFVTREGKSLNQKAINLHMLEDVLGWVLVLVGSILMKYTNIKIIDPILSILISIFIFKNAFLHLKEALDLFLEKKPEDINIEEIREHIMKIKGVINIHHFHIWAVDQDNILATMHVVSNKDVKKQIKEELKEHGVTHSTIEMEKEEDQCLDKECNIKLGKHGHHHHHHHHHI